MATDNQIELLIGTAEFDIRFGRDRVVTLHQRIHKFMQRNRPSFGITFLEIIAFQHACDRIFRCERQNVGKIHFTEPFAVEMDFRFIAIQNFKNLIFVRLRIGQDLFFR